MLKSMKCLLPMLMATAFVTAQELVKNGGFGEPLPAYGSLPAEWQAVNGTKSWGFVNDDGMSNNNSIMSKEAGAVEQKITARANTEYRLEAFMKDGDGKVVLEVIDGTGKALAKITAAGKPNVWAKSTATFKTGADAALTVRISATGKSWVDSVSVVPASQKAAAAPVRTFVAPGKNVALGKKYKFSRSPNYGLCTDKGDVTQLTDGVYTVGYFWTQKSTVGWTHNSVIDITIDLEEVQPICGVSCNIAAGAGGVQWPRFVNIYVSEDNGTWYYIGDLWQLCGKETQLPEPDKYAIFRVFSTKLATKGRWIKFMVRNSPFTFVDEIEIYRGADSLLAKAPGNNPFNSPESHYITSILQNRIYSDLDALEAKLGELSKTREASGRKMIADARAKVENMPIRDVSSLLTILPFCPEQNEVFAVNTLFMEEAGYRKPVIWRNNRWDNISPLTIPAKAKAAPMTVEMMRNEVRGETFNIMNPTREKITYTISVPKLPKDAKLDPREVLYTETKEEGLIASALKPAAGDKLTVTVLPGTSTQIWLSFKRPTLKAGTYKADVIATADGQPTLRIPLSLVIYDLDFPASPSLHVGGWDYTNGNGEYYGNPGNKDANLAIMRDIYVDSPWATPTVKPSNAVFDANGKLTSKLNFAAWDKWLVTWPNAKRYCVFFNAPPKFANEAAGTPRFDKMVAEYFGAWVEHMKAQGKGPEQLIILICDEPPLNNNEKVIIPWAKAIQKANLGIKVFEDPIYGDVDKANMEMLAQCDIICPNTVQMVGGGKKFRDFYLNQQAQGRTLWFYSCTGPAKLLDPITYHRIQKWFCIAMNAKGSFYWAMGCGGGSDSFHAFTQTGTEYSPYFVSKTDTMDGKQSEAVREGVQDFEYFAMLKARIAELKAQGKNSRKLRDAEKFVAEAPWKAMSPYIGYEEDKAPEKYNKWNAERDRSNFDKFRVQALKILAGLK